MRINKSGLFGTWCWCHKVNGTSNKDPMSSILRVFLMPKVIFAPYHKHKGLQSPQIVVKSIIQLSSLVLESKRSRLELNYKHGKDISQFCQKDSQINYVN